MRKLFFTKWLTTILVLLLLSNVGRGQTADPPVIQTLDGTQAQIAVNDEITVQDAKYYSSSTLLKRPYRTQSIVSLEINEGLPFHIHDNFTATVGLQIIYRRQVGSQPEEKNIQLQVSYNTTGTYNHKAIYVNNDFYEVTAKVTSMSSNVSWNPWKYLKIVNQLNSYPEYTFLYERDTVTQVSDSAWAPGENKDELPVWWTPVVVANEYDLEWTYIDSAALASGLYGDSADPNLELIFAHNASRVSIPATAYRIPLLYDSKGHLFYRVRAVQIQAGGSRYEAKWSAFKTTGEGRFDFNGHERSFNWQATTTFAEEGKRKSVVQYYDGSLRGRQTVTKDNSTNRTVVAESFYDYQGRPVINVLPAPTLNTIIGYTQNFNRGINAGEYDKNKFDSLGNPGEYCDVQAAPMDSISGASQYYSSLSPFKDSGVHKYVPNAGGFPFTEVEYTQDNTGRVTRQSGVGPDFRLGSGHETKYYYSTPDQRELDALFGTEVGDKSHYFKNLVRDANGQYSISYVDMRGRTIATALAGNPVANLQKLSSNTEAFRTETITDPYSVVIKDLVMEHKKNLTITTADSNTFTYQLNPLLLKETGCNMDSVCYDCLYDLRITITDDCNNQKLSFDTVVRNFSLIDTNCNNGTGFSFSFTKWMPEGSYEITKSLSVSRYALDYYRDSIFMAANTCKTLDSFIVEQRALQAQMANDCKPTCATCQTSLGTWPDYWTNFRQNNGIQTVDTAAYKNMALKAYDEALQQCAELCDSLSDVLSIRRTMLMDMTPSSGQYANIDNPQDRYSIFYSHLATPENRITDTFPAYSLITTYRDEAGNPDLVFDEAAGQPVPPQKLTPEVFAQRFKSSWADTLLRLHPEYCQLVRYEQLQASHEWDRKFEAVDSYAAAKAAGYLNPTSQTGDIETYFGRNTSGTDPLLGIGSGYFSGLNTSLNQYRKIKETTGGTEYTLSLWSVATLSVMCPEQSNLTACIHNYRTNDKAFNTSLMCEGELDMAWRTFRQLYLNIKQTYVNKWVKDSCSSKIGYMTPAQIMASGHSPHFTDAEEMKSLQSSVLAPASKEETEALLQQYYTDNCKAYATQWLQDLAPCTAYTTEALNEIIPALVAICKEGSDKAHPYGASSVNPSSANAPEFRSFEAYLKYYNATHNINDSLNCNAYGITAPKPYDQQVMHGNKPLYSKPDTCECSNITRLYNLYKPKRSRYGSFSKYLWEVYKTVAEDTVLNTLLSLCGNPDFPAADCDFISQRVFLPPVFQCNTGDICVDCDKFKQLDTEFRQRFPTARPVITDTLITDSAQLVWNRVYEQFMNYRLGYVKTAGEYLLFKSQCNGETYNPVCDSLQRIATDFRNDRRQTHGIHTAFGAEGIGVYTDLHDIVQGGTMMLPDSVRAVPSGWYNNVELYAPAGKGFCWNDGYAVEMKMRFLDNTFLGGDQFYFAVWNLTAVFGVYNDSIYLTSAQSRYPSSFPNYSYGPSGKLAGSDPTAWYTVKLKVTPSRYYIYFNGKLMADHARDPDSLIMSVPNFQIGIKGREGNLDWIKMYDANDQVKYFEDYNDPDNPALAAGDYLCPVSSPDCAAAFVTYFNTRTGGSYTYSQIDSIYVNSCSLPLAVCGVPGVNSDTLANWLNDYKRYGGIPHLDASGADTTHFKVNFGGTTNYTVGVPLGEVIKDGIMKLPAYYADTVPDGGNYFHVDFDRVKDTLCLDSSGFTFETRLRLPDNEVFPTIFNDSWWITLYSDPATSGSLLVSLKLTPDKGGAICTHQSDPLGVCMEENVPHLPMDVWRTVRLQFRGRQFSYYIDSMLVGTRTLDAPMTKLYWWTILQYAQTGEVDYIRIYDVNGRYLYNEEFNDPYNLAVPDRSLKCGGCEVDFAKYFNQRNESGYTYQQIDSLYWAAGIVLNACPQTTPACNKLDKLLTDFRNEYYNTPNDYVDLDMRTLAGDKTPDEGPKGVFDVNENLIGNTVDGTTAQVNASFAQIWNSSAVNQAVGTLSALSNGRFRLQLNPGQSMPCNGIIGMRYYQFDIPTDTLDAMHVGSGCYVDFGDGYRTRVQALKNGNTDIRAYINPGGGDLRFTDNRTSYRGYKILHYYSSGPEHTVTVYHSDIRTNAFYFDCYTDCRYMRDLKNLRGYIPSHILVWGFHSTQDSTFNSSSAIKNFNQVNTIELIDFGNGGGGLVNNFKNDRFGSFVNNRNLRSLWLDNANDIPVSQIRPISEYLPNLPQNFPELAHIRIAPYDVAFAGDMDFRLPKLRAFFLACTPSMTPARLDSLLIQVASTTTVDSGALGFWNLSVTRTSASDAAINTLISKKWWIAFNSTIINEGPLTNFTITQPAPDSIRYANEFSDYVNSKLGTNYTLLEILNLYQSVCGYQPDYCAGPDVSLTLCGRSQPVFPPTLLEAIDNCSDSTFFIQSKAQDLYRRYIDSLKGRFDSRYLAKCMQAYKYEQFTVRHKVSEYHYTLYYYDQAGNLVKTIPPAGVRPNYDSLWLDSVSVARRAGQWKAPEHLLPTQYRYNTLNQVTAQKSPDGGKTEFWYDRLGRLSLSRNARQRVMSTGYNRYYSYTKYDVLGRITEVGQLRDTLSQAVTDTFTRNDAALIDWHTKQLKNREQVTNTVYDIAYNGFIDIDPKMVVAQQNVRNRVSYVTYTDTPGITSSYNHGSFYSYDIHGNVDTLLQDYGRSDNRPNFMNRNGNRWKKFVYEYDLISGKVNKVQYQPGWSDQWAHRYFYDAENRLTEVQTSGNGYVWEKEAKYEYYLHGPLARTILGQEQVQGMDYAYTLQGWLKGVNSTGATATHDIGKDGVVGGLNQYVGRDALGFNLNYFFGDYKTINSGVASTFPAYRWTGGGLPDSVNRPLYNGNISGMATHLRMFLSQYHVPILYNYKYDQLNRLVRQDAFFNFDAGTNSYSADTTKWRHDYTFHERFSYDANGNIQNTVRHAIGRDGALMDSLFYSYYDSTNRLRRVIDHVPDNAYGTSALSIQDIDNQTEADNYVYDSIGNLIQDKQEKITSIKWNVYGKITEINRVATTNIPYTKIVYSYDAQGNRIGKVTNQGSGEQNYTWYVRDAQGNLISTYTAKATSPVPDSGLRNLGIIQADRFMYGSSRLGSMLVENGMDNDNNGPNTSQFYSGGQFPRGWRQYELTNHLGNVLTTVSDRKIGVYSNGSLTLPNDSVVAVVDYYEPHMVNATDYYAFGMPSRVAGSATGKEYRFGFNGQERSDEIKGFGNSYTAEFWEYDSRIGRRWNLDPRPTVGLSPYATFNNNPIAFSDPLGDTSVVGAGGRHTINIDEESSSLEFYDGAEYVMSGSKIKVPVKAGQLRSFTNSLGTFSARWIELTDGVVAFIDYKNDKGQTWGEAVREMTSSWKYKFLSWGNEQVESLERDPLAHNFNTITPLILMGASSIAMEAMPLNGSRIATTTLDDMSALGTLGMIQKAAAKPTGQFYSVAFEYQLASNMYPGVSYYKQFQAANTALNEAMAADANFASIIRKLGIKIPKGPNGKIYGFSPQNWVWHHHTETGVLQLVPKSQHPNIPGGIFWETLHPAGLGGNARWNKK